MENLINTENIEAIKDIIEDKLTNLSANDLLVAGFGSILLSSGLKMAGSDQIGSLVGKFSVPILALGLYKKYQEFSESQSDSDTDSPAAPFQWTPENI